MSDSPPSELFRHAATRVAHAAGTPIAFVCAALTIVGWGALGPVFGFSDTWQLVINTGTTILTFLMVFLIQNTQNRDARAIHTKLDEVIRAIATADDHFIAMEDLTDAQFEALRARVEAARMRPPPTPPLVSHPSPTYAAPRRQP